MRKKITDENILFKNIPTILIALKALRSVFSSVAGKSIPSFLMILFVISANVVCLF